MWLRRRQIDAMRPYTAITAAKLHLADKECCKSHNADAGDKRSANLHRPMTWANLAKKFHWSRRAFAYALKVLRECPPEVVKAAENDLVKPYDAARICHLPWEDQRAALHRKLTGKCRTLTQAMVQIWQERDFVNYHPELQKIYLSRD